MPLRQYKTEVKPLDPKQRYDLSTIAKKADELGPWKRNVFDILEKNKPKPLTAGEIKEKMVELGFRKNIDIDSVIKALNSLIENGVVLMRSEATPKYELNLKQ